MSTTTNVKMIFIGNFADMDTDESDSDNEAPSTVLGTHSDLAVTDIAEVDVDDDGVIYDDEFGTGDFISYDLGSGSVSTPLDSSSIYSAVVTLGDGSTITTDVLVIQAANGDVFFSDFPGGTSLDNLSIQSISLNSLVTSDAAGINRGTASTNNTQTVCYCLGSLIETPQGLVAIENIKTGDLVTTLDHGPQPVIWTNKTVVIQPGKNAPIAFLTGSLGPQTPSQSLSVSPQHRLLIDEGKNSPDQGCLIAAKNFLHQDNVMQSPGFLPVAYVHIAFQNHEIIRANGALTESILPGPQALQALDPNKRHELLQQFPSSIPARTILQGKRLKAYLAQRVNVQPMLT